MTIELRTRTVSWRDPMISASVMHTMLDIDYMPGSRVAFTEADLKDSDRRPVATAGSTLLVFPIGAR